MNIKLEEVRLLTPIQEFALPVLMWFFDLGRNRATGRSHLMAIVCIELAMRGEKVYLDDVSFWPTMGRSEPNRGNFMHLVGKILQENYNNHIFEIDMQNKIMKYKGKKPR